MKKEITLEQIEAQLAVVFRKLSEMEDKAAGRSMFTSDLGMYYLKELRKEAEKVITSDQNR